jgi:tetratricopeptide (TPR) repeat protein
MALEVRCLSDLERDLALSRSMLEFNPKRVLKLLEPHRDKQPDDVRLLVIASRAEAQLTNIESAELLAERAYTLAPDDVDTTVNMADQLVRNCLVVSSEHCHARWRRAIPLYRNALKLDRQRYDAVFGLGLSYLYSGHPGDAVNYFRVAYSKTPWAININFFLGESYRAIGDSRARIYLTNARNWAQSEFWRAVTEAALARLESS